MLETTLELGLVVVLAATPWIELVVVIPAGTAMGLPMLPVTATAFLGNALPVLAIAALFRWWERRRGPVQCRWGPRASRIWRRYGLPGLALLAPVVTGIHMATVMALALGTPRRRTVQWMVASLAGWTVVTGAFTALGIEQL